MSFCDPVSEDQFRRRQHWSTAIATANQNTSERALATVSMPLGILIEFFPCAAALWSADRTQCVFNGAVKTLLGYGEKDFCADPNLWLECIYFRDRQNFLSAWTALQHGQRKISCHYRFAPQNRPHDIALQETAAVLPAGPTAKPAILSLYHKLMIGRELRDDASLRILVHRIGNSLQAIRGELDLLHLLGTLPQQSYDNITQGIEQLHDFISEVTSRPGAKHSASISCGRGGTAVGKSAEKIS